MVFLCVEFTTEELIRATLGYFVRLDMASLGVLEQLLCVQNHELVEMPECDF